MTVELFKSELLLIPGGLSFVRLNPQQQKRIAIRVLKRRNDGGSNQVADLLLRGHFGIDFQVSDDTRLTSLG